ncbi:YecA/YgfB family protein [Roseovarius pacificus]|uniref:YecA/YgfB family protein n=1 Tax=Roseovarius pacificus TaxID=337701 RepID=UPI00403A52D6
MVDLETLDDYLSSDATPDDCMCISDLDGFIHGIVCSPVTIQPEEWVPVAFGGHVEGTPDWVIEAIILLFSEVAMGLEEDPPEVEPIFWEAKEGHVIAMDWCEGFMKAVSLRPKEWLRLTESGSDGHLVTPILVHLMDEQGNSVLGIQQEKLDEVLDDAARHIPNVVAGIFQFWRR